MATANSGFELTDSFVTRVLEPGFLPDVTALQATMGAAYSGMHHDYKIV